MPWCWTRQRREAADPGPSVHGAAARRRWRAQRSGRVGFTVSANVFLDSQTLTPEQEVRWQLGDTDGLVRLSGVAAPAGSPARDQLERESGPTSAWTMSLQHYDFPVPQVAPDQVTFEEMPWGRRLFGSRYLLEEGRWPRRPGEVVVIGGSGRAAAGRSLAVLGDPDALRVVGTGRGAFARETRLLAASGTWGSLRNPRSGLSQLDGSILAFLDQGAGIEQETRGLASLLSTTAVPHDYDARTSQVHQELLAGFADAGRVAREAPQRWTTASPLSFWVPSLTLGPMAVLVAFLSVSRRAGASLRSLVRAGVDQRTAVSGVTLTVMIWSVSAAVVGGAAGGLAGYVAAMWGSRGLGNPAPVVSFPWAGALCLVVSLLLGAAAGFLVLTRVAGPASTREGSPVRGSATHGQWRDRGADLRRTVAVVAGAVLLFLYTRLGSADDLLWVSGLATLVMAMLVPEATRTLARRWPEGRLTGRLSARLLQANLTRACVLTAVFAVAVGLCGGFLAAFNTAVQSERAAAVNASPTDQVVLDNDGSPTLPVPADVRRVAEAVPSLADQTPVQLYTVGRPARGSSGPPSHAVGVDTGYYLFNTLAFDGVGQVERAFATRLSKQERATLEKGGALVIDDRATGSGRRHPGRSRHAEHDVRSNGDPQLPAQPGDLGGRGGGSAHAHRGRSRRFPRRGRPRLHRRHGGGLRPSASGAGTGRHPPGAGLDLRGA